MKPHHTVRIAPGGEQFQGNRAVMGLDERNSFPNENGDDVNNELIDFVLIQKRSDDPASAHHPNILARLQTQSLRKSLDRLADELDSRLQRRLRLAGKHVVFYALAKSRRLDSLFDAPIVGLAAPQDSANALQQLRHSAVALGPPAAEARRRTSGAPHQPKGTSRQLHSHLA